MAVAITRPEHGSGALRRLAGACVGAGRFVNARTAEPGRIASVATRNQAHVGIRGRWQERLFAVMKAEWRTVAGDDENHVYAMAL